MTPGRFEAPERGARGARSKASELAGVGHAAVRAATGRSWAQWLKALDGAGARKLGHREIVALVAKHCRSGWWSQMVTVGYEQARGMREKHQTPRGYKVSGSRVVAVPVAKLYAAFAVPARRKAWLAEPLTVRTKTKDKSLRILWGDGKTTLEVDLYTKGPKKSLAQLQHSKLPDRESALCMKSFWAARLDALRARLET